MLSYYLFLFTAYCTTTDSNS